MGSKRAIISLLIILFCFGFSLSCSEMNDEMSDEIARELESAMNILMKEAEDAAVKLADEAKREAEKAITEKVDEAKDTIKDKTDELLPKPYICHHPEITDPAVNCMWKQVDAPVKNSPGDRSPEKYLCVIGQFDVENKYPGRYAIGGCNSDYSRCNIFAADVMRAMGAPLPTKGELGVGHGNAKHTDPMTANPTQIFNWIAAGNGGWRPINADNQDDLNLLLKYLKQGKPALAATPDHIAVVRPDHLPGNLTKDNLMGLHVAQAGGINRNDIALNKGVFGKGVVPVFFIHD